jgi:hypothetical protein
MAKNLLAQIIPADKATGRPHSDSRRGYLVILCRTAQRTVRSGRMIWPWR